MYLKETGIKGVAMDSFGSGQGLVVGTCEYGMRNLTR
jgi:hypothetical protein